MKVYLKGCEDHGITIVYSLEMMNEEILNYKMCSEEWRDLRAWEMREK